jgi:oxaloacetate decarboxylase (Na+ extruding) subunit alpha
LAHIELIETSLRDGNQSLWGATGLNTAMMLEIAPILDQVGFGAIDFSTSTHMAVAVRFKKENPWERLRLMRRAMPRTPLQFLTTGMRFISWELAHPEFMRLTFRLLIRAGIRRFAVMDSLNDMQALLAVARRHPCGRRQQHCCRTYIFGQSSSYRRVFPCLHARARTVDND